MNTPTTRSFRPQPRGSGAATPRVYDHLTLTSSREQLLGLAAQLRERELDYPLFTDAGDGQVFATFLWMETPGAEPASNVVLSANALVDHEDLEACEFEQPAPGIWSITLRVPVDWIASYRITVHRGATPAPWRRESERRAIRLAADAGGVDPLNPLVGASMSGAPVSLVRGPKAPASDFLAEATVDRATPGPSIGGTGGGSIVDSAQHPRMTRHELWDENCQRLRNLWVYQPPTPAEDTPLVFVHDGATWANYLNIRGTLDAAISRGALAPLHAVFIDSTTTQIRGEELPLASGTTRSLAQQFLPWAQRFLPVSTDPARTLITGASYGGLASVLTVLEHPKLFGLALAQSPSLWHTDLRKQLVGLDPAVRMLVQAGCYETEIFNSCQSVLKDIAGSPVRGQVEFQEISGGHDWAWWNVKLLEGLIEFFPRA
ncbi:enterochelin esterase domain-containing protein [Glutamicibacter sp.]|uniref:enterochelin esterase domain-containing protein n=1 Tax=Glutamicibacter sp. TaxID=1931995 RepID=UPI0028BDAC61|nr:alpha/beta hydrolase-fold protein [Glutamicibacter sp.]